MQVRTSDFIAPLHGLRGIAALLVVYSVGHGGGYIKLPGSDYAGSMGVALFFVLSGFLMAHLYLPKRINFSSVLDYAVARLARVYPLFAFVVLLSGVAYMLYPSWPFKLDASAVVAHLLGAGDGGTIWTISTELQFYGFFILIWWFYSFAGRYQDIWLILCLLVVMAISASLGYSDNRIALTGYLHVFLMGMLAALGYRNLDKFKYKVFLRRVAGLLLVVVMVVWGASGYAAPDLWGSRYIYHVEWLMMLTGLMVFLACVNTESIIGRLLGARFFVWLGEISFGIYLLHRPVIWFLKQVTPVLDGMPWPARAVALTLGVLLVAHVAHVALEKPARKMVREIGLSRQRSVNTTVEP